MLNLLNNLFSGELIKFIIFGLVFASVFLFFLFLLPNEMHAIAKQRLGVLEESSRVRKTPLLKWFRPFYTILVPFLSSSTIPTFLVQRIEKQKPILQKKLLSATLQEEITPDEFIAFKIWMSFFILFLVAYFFAALGKPLSWFGGMAILVGGFFFPDVWLSEKIKARRRSIIRAMPYTLDLLTLSVEAGLDFMAAIQRLSQRSKPNALLVELGHMLKEIRLGTSRSDALRNLSDRLQIEEISSFTTLLIQADQLGASVGQVLRAQSDQLRTYRFQTAETEGARASQLMLIPLVLCIFPAVFIAVLGPTLLNFLQKGLF